MTPPDPDLSLLGVAVAALTVIMGPRLALAVGAYSIIMLGWLGGVMVGAYRMPPKAGRWHLPLFVLVSLVATLGVTVPLAQVLADTMRVVAPWLTFTDAKGLLFFVAFVVPAVGHSWLHVAAWVWGLVRRRFGGARELPPADAGAQREGQP